MSDAALTIAQYVAKLAAEREVEKRQTAEWQTLYYRNLGMATSVWATLELVLDLHIHVISNHYDGKLVNARVPQPLQGKLTYLRRAFATHALAAFRDTMLPDLETIDDLSHTRHALIHGAALQGLGVEHLGTFGTIKLTFDQKTEHRLLRNPITVQDISKFVDQVIPLINRQAELGKAMRAPFPGGTLKDA
jgi:hypothetical protein